MTYPGKIFILLLFTVLVQLTFLAGQAFAVVSGEASVNPRLVRLGVPIQVVLAIRSDEQIAISRPAFPEPDGLRLDTGRITQSMNMGRQGEEVSIEYSFIGEYISEQPGIYEIGPFRIRYSVSGHNRELQIEPVTVEVFEDSPRPASNIVEGNMPPWWRYFIGALLLAILAGLIIGWRFLRSKRPVTAASPILSQAMSPEEQAMLQIRALSVPKAGDETAVKTYYDSIDEILRKYITERYEVATLDLTTFEIRREFHKRKRLDSRVTGVFGLMNDCDWVKFAKTRPNDNDIMKFPDRISDVLTGINSTDPPPDVMSFNKT
jgi:hypothetical protein